MTTEQTTWPKRLGRGWNTSDGYRFFHEDKAIAHQERVDDPDDEAGTHRASDADTEGDA